MNYDNKTPEQMARDGLSSSSEVSICQPLWV